MFSNKKAISDTTGNFSTIIEENNLCDVLRLGRSNLPKHRPSSGAGPQTADQAKSSLDVRIDLPESDEDTPVLGRSDSRLADHASVSTVERSRKNVSEWLDNHVNKRQAKWNKTDKDIDDSSARGSFLPVDSERLDTLSVKRHTPDRMVADSLDVTHHQETIPYDEDYDESPDYEGPEDKNEISEDRGGLPVEAEIPDEELGPPPCFLRPVSDELISVRKSNSQDSEDPEGEQNKPEAQISSNEENEAARTIQMFWRRHYRRKLAAQAALRRMMSNEKRRLIQSGTAAGMPIRAAMVRQKELAQKRRLEEHKKSSKALAAKRLPSEAQSQGSSAEDKSQISSRSQASHIPAIRNPCEIMQKPSSPLLTPRHGRPDNRKLKKNVTDESGVHAESEASVKPSVREDYSDADTLRNETGNDDFPEEVASEKSDGAESQKTMQKILADLNHLGSLEEQIDSANNRDLLTGPTRKNSPNGNSTGSRNWKEMLDEINRVLSEPDDEISVARDGGGNFVGSYSSAKDSLIRNPQGLKFSQTLPTSSRGKYSGTNNNNSNSEKARTLTHENRREHNRRVTSQHQRHQAQIEIEKSISQSRSVLDRLKGDGRRSDVRARLQNIPQKNDSEARNRPVNPTNSVDLGRPCQTSDIRLGRFLPGNDPLSTLRARTILGHHIEQNVPFISADRIPTQSSHGIVPDYSSQPISDDPGLQSLAMELEERTLSCQRLQRRLDQQRELSLRQLRDTQREAEQRVQSVKADYEATLARNYKLIDELIEEKKGLHTKCENLMDELKALSHKTEEKLKAAEDRYKVDLRKVEAKLSAAEKLRREKWEAEKTKQMKEMTVRGMESEIAQLIATHKSEMRQLRQSCAEQIQAADARAYQAYTSQIEELRQRLTREKEEACSREREAVNQRLEKTMQDERAALEVQRKRLLSEVAEERERLAAIAARERENSDKSRREVEDAISKLTEKYQKDLEQQRQELTDRHQNELEEVQKRSSAERQAWEEHTKSVLEAQYLARENALKDQLKRQRDRQLEAAVERLESELTQAKENAENEAEAKIKRIREKLGAEISELERSERQTLDKYCEMKTRLLDKEHESDRLKIQLNQREEEMAEVRVLYEKLNQERQNISDVVRQEFADRLVSVEEENKMFKRNLAELKARLSKEQERHEKELNSLTKTNEAELEAVHQKIKEAIKRKDEKLAAARESFEKEKQQYLAEIKEANDRAEHLEELLDQQRQQFLQSGR
ncbi:unnamed protein product [Calicophoron daubneyi]|uniref:Centrosomal protein of 131 kDa n=1 Tax=Calicophoron daubneyi TaxID=300641 RepID=A0AAV2TQ95_CALDB